MIRKGDRFKCKKKPTEPTTRDLIIKECEEVKELLLEKNRKYADSAFKRGLFDLSPTTAIKARIQDKLERLANVNPDENEDVIKDLIGYFILLRIAQKKEEFEQEEAYASMFGNDNA